MGGCGFIGQTASLFGTIWYIRRPDSMNVVILCGGLGTRLAEETELRPKPMIEIGAARSFCRRDAESNDQMIKHADPLLLRLAPVHRGGANDDEWLDYVSSKWPQHVPALKRFSE